MSFKVSDICNFFFEIENKYDLNNQEIQGCYAWQLIRIYLYYHISKKLGVFGSPQQKSLTLFDKIKTLMPFFKNSLTQNPLKGNYTKDILIFDHPRKIFFNNEYMDVYSYFLINTLKKEYSFEVLEAPYFNKHLSKHKNYIKYTDRIQLGSYIHKKLNKITLTQKEEKLIEKIKAEFEDYFSLEIDLERILKTHILNFQYDYKTYLKLFKKRKPKKIFVVVAYENQAIVSAAKKLDIEVIELQHGTVSDYHLGYSYPNANDKIEYFPDKILTFGKYWFNKDTCPIEEKNIIPVGFPYFHHQTKEYKNTEVEKNQILFISQGVIGKYLSHFALNTAENLKDYKIIYKLHPGEYETWKENYPELIQASKLKNFHIVDDNKTPLYRLLAQSNYQVGAFSTAIYEGLMFNCKTFIVNLPGIEYLNDLIREGYVFKVENYPELIENLNTFKPKEYDKSFFFKDFDEKQMKKVIDSE